jgi:hypothetical protein
MGYKFVGIPQRCATCRLRGNNDLLNDGVVFERENTDGLCWDRTNDLLIKRQLRQIKSYIKINTLR